MVGYKNLLTYKQCEEIHDLTVEFCERWIKSWKLKEQMIGAARSAILTSTAPLLALPLCAVLLKEKLTRYTLAGAVLAVAGVALVSL